MLYECPLIFATVLLGLTLKSVKMNPIIATPIAAITSPARLLIFSSVAIYYKL